MTADELKGRRFLVVEDEFVIAAIIEDYLTDIGCVVPWHADTVEEALRIVESDPGIDAAMLDMNLRGVPVDPVADALAARGIPFCFVTGYGSAAVRRHPEAPMIAKPFDSRDVCEVAARLLSAGLTT